MIDMRFSAKGTRPVQRNLGIQRALAGRITHDPLVFHHLVMLAFKHLVVIRADKDQFQNSLV